MAFYGQSEAATIGALNDRSATQDGPAPASRSFHCFWKTCLTAPVTVVQHIFLH